MRTLLLIISCSFVSFVQSKSTSKRPEPNRTVWTVSWSYDDRYLAVGDDHGELSIYEVKTWTKIRSWKWDHTTIARVEWNPKELVLAVASGSYKKTDSVVQLYNFATDKVLQYRPDSLHGRAVSWSADGEQVAFVGSKGKISIFTKKAGLSKTLSFTNSGSLMDIDWHPSSNKILAVEEDIYIIDIETDSLLFIYDDHSKGKGILCCQWHPSGNFFVTGDYGHENEGAEPSYVRYWDLSGKLLKQIKESRFEYRNVKWDKNGRYLVASGDVLVLLDKKGNVVGKTRFDDNNLWGAEFNHKGDKIASSDGAGNIRISTIKGVVLNQFRQ